MSDTVANLVPVIPSVKIYRSVEQFVTPVGQKPTNAIGRG